ncbi:exodeoxyribonuclease VII large subunit [Qingshengfaniella alkalisoli]|uniref:Exodeoxyribonuclease 7 large subunit n=1 Tax=Qingshengfaniella alkalisoli TaxID=2599296 RepID=A0A5B8I8Q3_9RHOB|nr:exodeoxyribonuclease VII large subunit [Qingshengfaniella alkalisoli]QDY69136.1 exodeoxyribonuclease VII large subunit [Qingshengfaniella alkalisoli]
MNDLIDDGPLSDENGQGSNAPEFTVSELSGAVKRSIESGFSHVRVRGEIGRVSRPRSGHVYLDLKDDRAVLAGVIWKGVASRLPTQPEEGLEVIATGRLTTFPGQSKYQIVIESIAPAGVGALMAMLEKRKKALEAEGLFASERKKPLPYLPQIIGVVTSPSGAVIRDILHRLRDRFPRKVLIWPVAVQGEKCAPEVTRAIEGFNRLTPGGALPRPDLLIVARGGGSIEDLWGFNEESVARAVAASEIPVISAVGHETDTTLVDFVSDRRAPTPTAAAELAVPVRAELLAWTEQQGSRLTSALVRGVTTRGQRLRDLSRALPRAEDLTRQSEQRLDQWADRLPRALVALVERRRRHLAEVSGAVRPAALSSRTRDARQRLDNLSARLGPALALGLRGRQREFAKEAARLGPRATQRLVAEGRRRLPQLSTQMVGAIRVDLNRQAQRLTAADRLLEGLSYHGTLKRGYAVIRAGDQVVTNHASAAKQPVLDIEFSDGRLEVATAAGSTRPTRSSAPKSQPSLFDE